MANQDEIEVCRSRIADELRRHVLATYPEWELTFLHPALVVQNIAQSDRWKSETLKRRETA